MGTLICAQKTDTLFSNASTVIPQRLDLSWINTGKASMPQHFPE